MKKVYSFKRSMYYVVEEFIGSTPLDVLDLIPEFDSVFSQLVLTMSLLPEVSEVQHVNRKGLKLKKAACKQAMVVAASDVSARIRAYAVNTKNVVLGRELSTCYSKLSRRADGLCSDYCLLVYNKGVGLVQELADYGVTAEVLEDLRVKREVFMLEMPKPRLGIVRRKMATAGIARLIKECDGYLAHMDVLVEMLRFSHPKFYSSYIMSRKLVTNGHRTMAVIGKVVDERDVPLQHVSVEVKDIGVRKRTGSKGGFEIKSLESKVYEVIFRKPGFEDAVALVAVTATERSKIRVVMREAS
jgi:hypothetical protein